MCRMCHYTNCKKAHSKGVTTSCGHCILLSAPIMNPVVLLSTVYAFQKKTITLICTLWGNNSCCSIHRFNCVLSLSRKKCFKRRRVCQFKKTKKSWKDVMNHTADEFFDTGKYLLIGAFLASVFQTFFDRNVLDAVAHNEVIAPIIMMGFGYVLSICSAADSFIAASFGHVFSVKALLAFLVFGLMLDMKNTFMLFAYFQKRFVFF